MTQVIVLRAGPDDWVRVRAVRLAALADTPDAFGATLAEEQTRPPERWQERLRSARAATFLAVRREPPGVRGRAEAGPTASDEVLGLVVGAPFEGRPGSAGLFSMWVAPDVRGRGVGDALVEAVVRWARGEGWTDLVLDVADDNLPAVRLYARHGFAPTGLRGALPPPRQHVSEHQRLRRLT